jgi:uncharacterized protein (TIGR02466 family)
MIGGREDWFPTSVWGFDHPDSGPLNTDLLTRIYAERDADPKGLSDRSTVLGWHSKDDQQKRSGFEPLATFLEGGIAEAVNFLKWDRKQVEPVIATCWANVNGPGASNVVHTHPLCFLSGVYYVKAEPNCGRIFFLDPRPAAVMTAPPMSEFSPWTFQQVRYEPKPGRMLIFPSWLQHGVEPNRSATDRVCISFNVGLKWLAK